MNKTPVKIVIDTNLLVAYMFKKSSASANILAIADEGLVDIMWHDKIRKEAELITGKIGRAVPKVKMDLNDIFKKKNEVKEVPKVRGVSEDPDDDKFLACAIAAGADMIISNDAHLLDIENYEGIPIYTSSAALKVLNK
ncbi:MAG: putative toxin-antitoxin system toxin component, PIN family [Candidatus Tantalella remota]|nr:putative toxin-antitoxin system toxin component, PIN family [Candidatus Tantalella remota]